ncbi:hypothetical protein NB311A_17339 [Nitrobacter sp. Nb-311A]|uniref:DUF4160 domain-containing protein n=1 Tax=Nitrobacter sp. TaxID=29420 RepID=UPI0000687399|nr:MULTISPECIES: DUF4160 domain-containing protein [unclassified Nitrobacter]EAQ35562.1 hypothetical protein NB311A_17339 [Nitrobacter sp. Nb-311A]MCB1392583.1 DUF4160 domain-containing protein [Nitrobacter sp.]MCV0385915.1 DUF4160 domain-containing protein [Nitrobacter sp.]
MERNHGDFPCRWSFREDGLRYYFFSNEGQPPEPIHVHVRGRGCDAKIWLAPDISIAESYGFNSRELSNILHIVAENRDLIVRASHEHFGI